MAAPKGNKYAKGNKGGGRKSAYEEFSIAETIHKAFIEGVNKEQLEKKVKSRKKVKLVDHLILRAFESDRVLLDLTKRITPDVVEQDTLEASTNLADAIRAACRRERVPQRPEEPPVKK